MSSLRSLSASRRHPDPTFEKLMSVYKHYLKALPIISLILSSPSRTLPLSHISHPLFHHRFHLSKGAPHFLRSFPHIFSLSPDPATLLPTISLTPAASLIVASESAAADRAADEAANRLTRILMMTRARAVPMRAVFRAWRELGLPDDFEGRVLGQRRDLFRVRDNPREKGTHVLELDKGVHGEGLVARTEEWRSDEGSRLKMKKNVDEMELRYGFKQQFPPGMRLTKIFRSKLKDWQCLPYVEPYEPFDGGVKRSREGLKRMEKRAVGIVHEFLSLTVEKMADVEQVSQFRKWFGIDLNIRDLFLDHPGIFYVSTKGKRHTVFLREAYEKGRLVEPNPIYDARMKLLELVAMRRRGVIAANANDASMMGERNGAMEDEAKEEEEEEDDDEEYS